VNARFKECEKKPNTLKVFDSRKMKGLDMIANTPPLSEGGAT